MEGELKCSHIYLFSNKQGDRYFFLKLQENEDWWIKLFLKRGDIDRGDNLKKGGSNPFLNYV